MSLSRMRRALAPRLAAGVAACVLISALVGGVNAQDAPAALTIDDAVARALDAAPLLRAGEEGLRAADGAYRQAGARPNPELLIEAENFAGSGDFNGVGGAEFSYSLGQQIERGGKRRARRAVAAVRNAAIPAPARPRAAQSPASTHCHR